MAKYTMDMVLQYAKVFPENADYGDPKGNRVAKSIADKGGQYIVQGYFTDPDQISQLLEDGLDPEPMNSPRIIDGDAQYGIGKYMKLKRMVKDVKKFTDRYGKPFEKDYGGAPNIVNLTNGMDKKTLWSFEEDGPLGNGTKAKVQFETYSNGAGVRLLNVGITEHVPYTSGEPTEDDKMFMVG